MVLPRGVVCAGKSYRGAQSLLLKPKLFIAEKGQNGSPKVGGAVRWTSPIENAVARRGRMAKGLGGVGERSEGG